MPIILSPVVDSIQVVSVPSAVAYQDATSGWYLPRTTAEWTELLYGTGIPSPTSLYTLQEASGNLADTIGIQTIDTLSGGFSYQQTAAGWTRKCITAAPNSWGYSSASAADSVQSKTVLSIGMISAVPAAGANADICWASNSARVGCSPASLLVIYDGSGSSFGALNPTGQIRPFFAVYDNASTKHLGATDAEATALTAAAASPTMYTLVGNFGGGTGTTVSILYTTSWLGTALTATQIATIASKIKNGPAILDIHTSSLSITRANLTKTAGVSGWNGGASSTLKIAGDGYVSMVIESLTMNRLFGLSYSDPDQDYASMDYAFYTNGATVYVFQSGFNPLSPFSLTTVAIGDTLRIKRTGTTVTYEKMSGGSTSWTTLYTSLVSSTGSLLVDTALLDVGDTLAVVSLYDVTTKVPITWTNVVNASAVNDDSIVPLNQNISMSTSATSDIVSTQINNASVKTISVINTHATISNTVTVKSKKLGAGTSTSVILWTGTLLPYDSLRFDDYGKLTKSLGMVPRDVQVYGAQNFTSNTAWVVPAGCTEIYVECWGSGAGAGGVTGGGASGGGGGGAYSAKKLTGLVAGTSYDIIIGAAGTGGNSSGTDGINGALSKFSLSGTSLCLANGGTHGTGSGGGVNAGGAGGSTSGAVGDVTVAGGAGATGGFVGGGGGGSGGPNGAGSAPTNVVGTGDYGGASGNISPLGRGATSWPTVAGRDGTFPGGGGSGADNGSFAGGNGAGGLVSITCSPVWTKPTLATHGFTPKFVEVICIGGGGGGGVGGTNSGGAGGGGGCYNSKVFHATSIPATVSIQVGTGGYGGDLNTNDGGSGDTSIFGKFLSAFGGGGGQVGTAVVATGGGGGGTASAGVVGSVSGSGGFPTPTSSNSQFVAGSGANASDGQTAGGAAEYGGAGGGGSNSTNNLTGKGGCSLFGGAGGGGGGANVVTGPSAGGVSNSCATAGGGGGAPGSNDSFRPTPGASGTDGTSLIAGQGGGGGGGNASSGIAGNGGSGGNLGGGGGGGGFFTTSGVSGLGGAGGRGGIRVYTY